MEHLIGKKVKYARMDQDRKIHEGEGVVHGLFIGPDKRLQVRVHDGVSPDGRPISYNIDPVAIDITPDGLIKYTEHLQIIEEISVKCNTEIKALAAAGNAEILALNVAYMGPAFDI